MKRFIQEIKKGNMGMMIMLMLLAVLTGGVGMAEGGVLGAEGPDPVGKDEQHDPADPESGTGKHPDDDPDGRLAPGDTTAGQNLDGTQASSTQARQGELEEDEWDVEITKFQPFRNPLLAIARQVTRKQNISNWSVKHGRMGG